jgi:hypothetical protein
VAAWAFAIQAAYGAQADPAFWCSTYLDGLRAARSSPFQFRGYTYPDRGEAAGLALACLPWDGGRSAALFWPGNPVGRTNLDGRATNLRSKPLIVLAEGIGLPPIAAADAAAMPSFVLGLSGPSNVPASRLAVHH